MTYDYKCNDCGNTWEVERSIKDTNPEVCPVCHNIDTEVVHLTAPPTIFNGPGWTRKSR